MFSLATLGQGHVCHSPLHAPRNQEVDRQSVKEVFIFRVLSLRMLSLRLPLLNTHTTHLRSMSYTIVQSIY